MGLICSLAATQHILAGFGRPYFYPWNLILIAVIIGGILGIAIGAVVSQFQLRVLSNEGEFKLRKHIPYELFIIGSGIILLGTGLFFIPSMSSQNKDLLLDSLLTALPALNFSLVGLFLNWERKHKGTIMSGTLAGLYVLPRGDRA